MPAVTDLDVKAPRRPSWREEDHPRDRLGRFIEIGAHVQMWGGARGTVLGNAGGGRIEVARDGDGKRFLVGSNRITVIERPDGGEPTDDADKAEAAPVTPAADDAEVEQDESEAAPLADPGQPDYAAMRRQDFDTDVPLSLFDEDDARPTSVEAAPRPKPALDDQMDLFADLDGAPPDLFTPSPEQQQEAEQAVAGAGAAPDPDPEPERGHETVEETRDEFNMPADRVEEAIRRVDAANRRAERAGVEGRIGYSVEHYERTVDDGTGIPKYEQWARFTLDVPEVKHDGFTFVATLTWDEDAGLVTRTRPGQALTRRPEARKCDVCKSARDRKDTYVVREDATGEETQVGSNCLTQFMGIRPAGLWMLGYDGDLDDLEGDDEERERGGGGGDLRVSSLDALGVGLAIMRERGWVSKSAAEAYNAAGGSKMSTADTVADVLWGKGGGAKVERWRREVYADGQALADEAQGVLDLARTLDGDSDYVLNLRAVAGGERVSSRNLPLLVSALAAKAKRDQDAADRAAVGDSEWIGKPKDKIKDVPAKVTGLRYMEGYTPGSVKTLVTLVTSDGNVIKWWASKSIDDVAVGDEVTVSATIKEHGEFRGVKETTVQRAVLGKTGAAGDAEAEKMALLTNPTPDGYRAASEQDRALAGPGTTVRWEGDRVKRKVSYRSGIIREENHRRVYVEATTDGERGGWIDREALVAVESSTFVERTPVDLPAEWLVDVPEGMRPGDGTTAGDLVIGQEATFPLPDTQDTRDGKVVFQTGTWQGYELRRTRGFHPGPSSYGSDGSTFYAREEDVATAVGPAPAVDTANPNVSGERHAAGMLPVAPNAISGSARERADRLRPVVGQVVRVRIGGGYPSNDPTQYATARVVSLDPMVVQVLGDDAQRTIEPVDWVGVAPRREVKAVLSVKRLGGTDKWDATKHPRDRLGRFIEVGSHVSVWGGGQGRVASMGSNGRVQVDLTTGKRVEVDAGHLTVLRAAGGGTPERAPAQTPPEPDSGADPSEDTGEAVAAPEGAAQDGIATPEQMAALLNNGLTGEKYEQDEQAHREAVQRIVQRIDQVPDDLLLPERTLALLDEKPPPVFTRDAATGMWRMDLLDPPRPDSVPADDPQVREGLRQAAVSSILTSWATGSSIGLSRAVQTVAAQEFGIPEPERDVADQRKDKQAEEIVERQGEGIRAVLRAMHEETQDRFRAAGITHVQVHRGFQWQPGQGNPRPAWADQPEAEVPLRALSSFTLDREIAERFGARYAGRGVETTGEVISGTVPVDRLLSIPRTGLGRNAEQEVVVLGGQPLRFQVGEQPADPVEEPGAVEADALAPEAGADVAATIPGAERAPDATPVGAFAYFANDESSSWYVVDGENGDHGYLRTNKDDPSTTLRMDADTWSEETERRGLAEQPVPTADTAAAPQVEADEPVAGSFDITTGPDDRAASPEQIETYLRAGLTEFGAYGQEHSGRDYDPTGTRFKASQEARAEVVADIGRRMQHLDDRTLLGEEEAAKVERLTSGETVLARKPRRNFAGEVMADSWDYREVPAAQWNALTAIPDEVEVVDPDGYREQKRAEAVNHLVSSWARSSNDANATSLALQATAADLFGIEHSMEWPLLDPSYDWYNAGLANEVETLRVERGEVMEAFLSAQYDATQERFAEAGITHVQVYRGHGATRSDLGNGGWIDDVFTDYTPDGVDVAIPMRPASSFTADPGIALAFSGQNDPTRSENLVLTATVPVERILGTSRSGWGSQEEAEIVVLGGTDTWRVQRAADFDPVNIEDPRFAGLTGVTEPDETFVEDDPGDRLDPATAPVSMLADHDELQTAITLASPDDPERRAALIRRAETLGMTWAIPASWRDDATGGDPMAYDPQGTDQLTADDYAAAAAVPVESISTAKEYAAAIMHEWMQPAPRVDQDRRRALAARYGEFTIVGAPPLPPDWSA